MVNKHEKNYIFANLCGHTTMDTCENNIITTKIYMLAFDFLHREAPIYQRGIENRIGKIIRCVITNQSLQIQQNWDRLEVVHKVNININP
jgi:hypothetical protein